MGCREGVGRRGAWIGLEEDQALVWPPSRSPMPALKGAKMAKAANACVTVVTDVTYSTLIGWCWHGCRGSGVE